MKQSQTTGKRKNQGNEKKNKKPDINQSKRKNLYHQKN